jgi:large subunit ribosomal protein L31
MKKEIHPKYDQVVFQDTSSDFAFLCGSTLESSETIKWEDGKTYPLIKVEVSSASHPFYTGKQRVLDKGGRIEKFQAKLTKAASGAKAKKSA